MISVNPDKLSGRIEQENIFSRVIHFLIFRVEFSTDEFSLGHLFLPPVVVFADVVFGIFDAVEVAVIFIREGFAELIDGMIMGAVVAAVHFPSSARPHMGQNFHQDMTRSILSSMILF